MLSTPVEVMEGEPFVLNVTASASPSKLDYTWERDNGQEKITNDPNSGDIWFSGGFLHLARVSRDHAGTYRVTANNSEGQAVATVKLDVLFSPKYANRLNSHRETIVTFISFQDHKCNRAAAKGSKRGCNV